MLATTAIVLLCARCALCAVSMPELDMFWIETTQPDFQTIALWNFDETAQAEKPGTIDLDKVLDGLLDEAMSNKPPSGKSEIESVGRAFSAEVVRLASYDVRGGDYEIVQDGKFRAAIRLSPGAYLFSSGLPLAAESAATFDFWIKPESSGRAGILLDFPAAQKMKCSLRISADGEISLETGKRGSFAQSRKLEPGEWSHVVLQIGGRDGIALLVNGMAERLSPELEKLFPARAGELGNAVAVGGSPGREQDGFAGQLDQVRISKRKRDFYELNPPPAEAGELPPLSLAMPWFTSKLDPLVELTFNDESVAGAQAGKYKVFTDGARGRAADFRNSDFTLAFPSGLSSGTGTLEFWMRPLDWNNFASYCQYGNDGNPPSVPLFSFAHKTEEGGCKGWDLSAQQGHKQPQHGLPLPVYRMHPGQWTHVLIVWKGDDRKIYLDGKPQALGHVQVRGSPKEQIEEAVEVMRQSEGSTFFRFRRGAAALDEIRLFDWALDDDQAANAHARFFADSETRLAELDPLKLSFVYDYYRERLNISGRVLPIFGDKHVKARITLDRDGKVESADKETDGDGKFSVSFPAALEFGPAYPVDGQILVEDQPAYSFQTNLVRIAPEWWRNELGKDRIVPDPWTPAVVEGRKLSVWGRTVELAESGLPASLVSAGAELLKQPAVMRARTAGSEILFAPRGELRFEEIAPDRVIWRGGATGDGIEADIEGELEYDGLLRFRVTLKPAAGKGELALDSLDLDIPMDPEFATQLIANGGGRNFRASWYARFLATESGRIWDSKSAIGPKGVKVGHFLPVVWIGDDARGICFFGENDRGWTPHADETSQEVHRGDGVLTYRMRIVSRPITLSGPREFEFFMHPTPTKPLPPGWRGYNRGVPPVSNYESIDAFISQTLTAPADMRTHAGITFELEPQSWEDAAINSRMVGRFGEHAPRLFYIDYSWPRLGPSMREFMQVGLWSTGRMTWTPEVEDYMTWVIAGYISRDIIEGIYIDDTSLGSTMLTQSTAYELEDGSIQPGFVTMGFRRFLKRVWTIFALRGQRARIVPHMTYCYEIPALSFADAVVNGEDRDLYAYTKNTTLDVWPFNQLRVMGGSEKWGFIQFWKSGVDGKTAVNPARLPEWMFWQNRALKAAMLLHDMEAMWGAKAGTPELIEFGVHRPGIQFLRHHELVPLLRPDTDKARLSAYRKDDSLIITIVNSTDAEFEVTLRPDESILAGADAGSGLRWSDAEKDMLPPKTDMASAAEIKGAAKALFESIDDLGFGQVKELGEEDATRLLEETVSPEEKERTRLAPRVSDDAVTVPVRAKDYRMLRLEFTR